VMDANGNYNLKYNMESITEDYYLPVRGGDSGTNIDTLPGLGNDGAIEDVEYLRNKMMAALKIPKAFLGYDENVGSKATLAAEDVRFARTIERLQKTIVAELEKIAIIHLYTQGFDDAELINFELELTNPSMIHQQEKLELLTQKKEIANDLIENKHLEWNRLKLREQTQPRVVVKNKVVKKMSLEWKNKVNMVVIEEVELVRKNLGMSTQQKT
jgi:hypothetical protein